jgi:hypothetical protein
MAMNFNTPNNTQWFSPALPFHPANPANAMWRRYRENQRNDGTAPVSGNVGTAPHHDINGTASTLPAPTHQLQSVQSDALFATIVIGSILILTIVFRAFVGWSLGEPRFSFRQSKRKSRRVKVKTRLRTRESGNNR